MDNIKIQSRNVDGLRDASKRKKMFLLLKSLNFDMFLLQETHSTPETEKMWLNEWGGDIIFSHGTSNSKGVAVLFNALSHVKPINKIKDKNGRYIITTIQLGDKETAIINVYGPNEDNPAFFWTCPLFQKL